MSKLTTLLRYLNTPKRYLSRKKIAKKTKETRQLIDQMKVQKKVSVDLHQDAQKIPTNDGEAQEARFRKLQRQAKDQTMKTFT